MNPTAHDTTASREGNLERTDSGSVLREYWRVLTQRRSIIASCVCLVTGVVMILTFFTTPIYEASTTLQIDRRGPEILTFQDVVGVESSSAAYQDFYHTQYKILQTKTVIRLAVDGLGLTNRPEFVKRPVRPLRRLTDWVRVRAGDTPPAKDEAEAAIDYVQEGLAIQPVRNTQLLRISFANADPVLARDVANAMADAYLAFNFKSRYDTTAVAKDFLTEQVARIQEDIDGLEYELQTNSTEKEILALSAGTQSTAEQSLASLNAQYSESRANLALAQARSQSLSDLAPEALPEVLASPLITTLKEQFAEVERRHSQMSERFKGNWPALLQLRQELNQSRERIGVEAEKIADQVRRVAGANLAKVQAEVARLSEQVELLKVEVQRTNRDAISIDSLRSSIEMKRKVLGELIARQSETDTSDRLQGQGKDASNVRVVDVAETPQRPIRPRRTANLLIALLLGSALGIGMAFLLDHLDNTIKNEQEVRRIGGLSVLGHVPSLESVRISAVGRCPESSVALQSHLDPRSAFAEAFKNLRTSILLSAPDRPPRHILVTSCEPGAGKSSVSLNLAIVMTQLGRRVLLVDADLRRPQVHRVLDLPNTMGLSSLLSGNAGIDELILETQIPDLYTITSGPIPPNPSELLGSPRLPALLATMQSDGQFDHVIFDSPPLLSASESAILASCADATVVVVRAGQTTRESLSHATSRLRQSRAAVLSAVLNAVPQGEEYYYYGRTQDRGDAVPVGAALTMTPPAMKLRRRGARRA